MDASHYLLNHKTSLAGALFVTASLLSFAAAARQPFDFNNERAQRSPAEIIVRNGTLYFDGEITADAAQSVLRQLDMRRVDGISVNSIGGDVTAAITIGQELYKRQMDVEVRNICADACASYLFPAGKSQFLSQGSLLLWSVHPQNEVGELPPETVDNNKNDTESPGATQPNTLKQASALKQEVAQFYQQIGVNSHLSWCPQWSTAPDFPAKWFSWSVENLAKFGVKNLSFATSATRWQKDMADKGVAFADYCP